MSLDNNLDEYTYPDLYDLENPDFEPEGPFFLSIAQEVGGPVLELGCGTGRMTIPFARQGFEITGLDIVPQMLAAARAKASDLPIQWVEADVRRFDLGWRFKFIFENGSVFMHMLTNADQAAFLDCAHRHLAPGGRFVVSSFFPHPDRLATDLEEKDWFTYADQHGRPMRVSGIDEYDELRQVKIETAVRRFSGPNGEEIVHRAPLALRYTFPQEMEALLEHAGFTILERYGGPERSPLTGASALMVYVCTHRSDTLSQDFPLMNP